jgi:hypothetical protein
MHGITLPSDSQFQRLVLVANAVFVTRYPWKFTPDDPYHAIDVQFVGRELVSLLCYLTTFILSSVGECEREHTDLYGGNLLNPSHADDKGASLFSVCFAWLPNFSPGSNTKRDTITVPH